MSGYKSYLHVERLENPECEGLLQNDTVVITAKIDGTNGCVYWDADLKQVGAGSRKRPLTMEKDNADFYAWIRSGHDEAIALRRLVVDHPHLIVYGEWLGSSKFIGSIKTYDSDSLGHFYIFDMFDIEKQEYLADFTWRDMARLYGLKDYCVEILAVLDHPSYDDVVAIAENNKFLLSNAENKGEGVVCKVPGWKNKYGRTCYGKVVLAEFHEHKSKSKHKVNTQAEDIEKEIVEYFVTESELAKAKEKTAVFFNEEFKIEGKFIGYYFNELWNSLLDDIFYILKKYNNPIINFRVLRAEVQNKGKKYLGLI